MSVQVASHLVQNRQIVRMRSDLFAVFVDQDIKELTHKTPRV